MQYIYGIHAVKSALFKENSPIEELFVLKSKNVDNLKAILDQCQSLHIPVNTVEKTFLDSLSHHENHQGIVAKCQESILYKEKDIPELLKNNSQPFILILDSVQDPHNLGACLRSADAAGVNFVIAPKDGAASITPVVRKIACGAADTVPFIPVTNLVRTINLLKESGVWVYGFADNASESIFKTTFATSVALVMGAEGQGLRRLVREACDEILSLPMAGSVSSLNVSVATGIALYEVIRQRNG